MRRQDIQLIALARQGDRNARIELGRRYLLGGDGFTRHVAMGVEYLNHESVRGSEQAVRIVGDALPLQDIVRHDQVDTLQAAARLGLPAARAKLATWLLLSEGKQAESWLELQGAAQLGHLGAARALAAVHEDAAPQVLALQLLRSLTGSSDLDGVQVAELAVRQAMAAREPERALLALHVWAELGDRLTDDALNELTVQAVALAESCQTGVGPLLAGHIEHALELGIKCGDMQAAYILGRALCGIACGAIPATCITETANVRGGAALLLRAADAGVDDAWLHLYWLHANHRLSVANPQMARFFLEKSAARGHLESQRRLGALMLRSSSTVAETTQAISWLHEAAEQGDSSAASLLDSLVLPLPGTDEAAQRAVERVRREDPSLAVRMQLAREFGLTKLEALCVDPVSAVRPWGLLVGRNPFVMQSRRAAPRAIPARRPQAREALRRAAFLFAQSSSADQPAEAEFRRRSLQQRRLFSRLGIDEDKFFSKASSTELDVLRQGPKWAHRAKDNLEEALAA